MVDESKVGLRGTGGGPRLSSASDQTRVGVDSLISSCLPAMAVLSFIVFVGRERTQHHVAPEARAAVEALRQATSE